MRSKLNFVSRKTTFRLLLRIPEVFRCKQGTVCAGMIGLCIVLKRPAYPCRYGDIISTFGLSVLDLCMIYNTVIDHIFEVQGHLISPWNHAFLSTENLQLYAESVDRKGAAFENCFRFVDGTVRPICRPNKNQRIVYNGLKKVHSLKFQSVALPN